MSHFQTAPGTHQGCFWQRDVVFILSGSDCLVKKIGLVFFEALLVRSLKRGGKAQKKRELKLVHSIQVFTARPPSHSPVGQLFGL